MMAVTPISQETFPSCVQTHLGFLQDIISRMASNSASCKKWCITIVVALLGVSLNKADPLFAVIGIIPILFLGVLDAYYLAFERGFRCSYNLSVKKIQRLEFSVEDIYSLQPVGKHFIASLGSFSVWGFYTLLTVISFVPLVICLSH